MEGSLVRIGSTHGKKYGYTILEGAIARVYYQFTSSMYIVKLLSTPKIGGQAHLLDEYAIHQEDLILLDEEEFESGEESSDEAATEELTIDDVYVGSFIRIGSQYADKMDYEACVDCDAIVKHKFNSYIEANILTGEDAGKVKDIHVEDVLPAATNYPETLYYVLVDHEAEIIYYSTIKEQVATISNHIDSEIVRAGNVSSMEYLLSHYGYLSIRAEDSEWAGLFS